MSITESKFVEFAKRLFGEHRSDYEKIVNTFQKIFKDKPKERDRLPHYAHFYYFICTPGNEKAREELQIVGLTSLMEAMMGDVEYKDVFSYFESEFPKQNIISDYRKFKEDYLQKYGATKKVVKYFNDFIPETEVENILEDIKIWNNNDKRFEPFNSIDQLARFLYQMRSDFVHGAEMRCFCPIGADLACIKAGDNYYNIKVGVADMLKIFEKSFVKYWDKKYEELKQKYGT